MFMTWRPACDTTRSAMRAAALTSAKKFPPYAPKSYFYHEILYTSRKQGSRARVGRLHTPHGVVDTPGFVAVGTNGAIKGVTHAQANDAGMQLMFANALHMLIHPGPDVIENAGGLHSFIGRHNRPLITDSGGFQIFSFANRGELAMPGGSTPCGGPGVSGDRVERSYDEADDASFAMHDSVPSLKSSRPAAAILKWSSADSSVERVPSGQRGSDGRSKSGRTAVKVTEEGARFRSYRDGTPLLMTPESSVAAQKAYGADIILPLDDLPSVGVRGSSLAESLARTHRWEARSLRAHLDDPREQAMYGIVHGGTDRQLRARSIEELAALPFDGFAIGGSVGRDRSELVELLRFVVPNLPEGRPNHLLGIGDEESIAAAVRLGVDTFDSCFPTRMGRHGNLLTRTGKLRIGQTRYRDDYGPVDVACDGFVSTQHTRAYLHHLWKAHEPIVHG